MSSEDLKCVVDELIPPTEGTQMDSKLKSEIVKIFKFDSIEDIIRRSKNEATQGSKIGLYCTHTFEKVSPFALKLTFEIMKRA